MFWKEKINSADSHLEQLNKRAMKGNESAMKWNKSAMKWIKALLEMHKCPEIIAGANFSF
jgi:hypothetical protein